MDLTAIIQQLVQDYGLIGLFLGALIANATLFFPLPMDGIVFLFGAMATNTIYPLLVGIAGGAGAALGECTGYILGFFGIKTAEKLEGHELKKIHEIEEKLNDKGMIFIYFASLIPFPFDFVGITAGILKYPVIKFLSATMLGKITRNVIIAYAGYFGLTVLKGIFFF